MGDGVIIDSFRLNSSLADENHPTTICVDFYSCNPIVSPDSGFIIKRFHLGNPGEDYIENTQVSEMVKYVKISSSGGVHININEVEFFGTNIDGNYNIISRTDDNICGGFNSSDCLGATNIFQYEGELKKIKFTVTEKHYVFF